MKALVMSKRGLQLRQFERPTPKNGESLLKVRKAGICGTDLAIVSRDYKIPKPVALGHEICAVVAEGEDNGKFRPGTRVTTEINVSCGKCALCKAGLRNHCSNIETLGITRNGGFEEFLSVPLENLHKIPDSISEDQTVFVEPLAAAVQLTKMAPVEAGSTCAVVGTGRLGVLILQVLKLRNPALLVAVVHNKRNGKKSLLAKSFGADNVFASDGDLKLMIRETNGIGFDHVVEATGRPEGLELAMKIVRPCGTIHVKSTHGVPAKFNATQVAVHEIRIQGSRCGPFEEAITLLKDGKIRTSELINGHFRLDDFNQAFANAREPGSLKVMFEM
jgi:alcohol dehydrogenase